jgi:hypothetical protein
MTGAGTDSAPGCSLPDGVRGSGQETNGSRRKPVAAVQSGAVLADSGRYDEPSDGCGDRQTIRTDANSRRCQQHSTPGIASLFVTTTVASVQQVQTGSVHRHKMF